MPHILPDNTPLPRPRAHCVAMCFFWCHVSISALSETHQLTLLACQNKMSMRLQVCLSVVGSSAFLARKMMPAPTVPTVLSLLLPCFALKMCLDTSHAVSIFDYAGACCVFIAAVISGQPCSLLCKWTMWLLLQPVLCTFAQTWHLGSYHQELCQELFHQRRNRTKIWLES